MSYENVPLGFNEQAQQWKLHTCCHTCGDAKEIICFEDEDDYVNWTSEDFPCYNCWIETEMEMVKKGSAENQEDYQEDLKYNLMTGPFPESFVKVILNSKNPGKYDDEKCVLSIGLSSGAICRSQNGNGEPCNGIDYQCSIPLPKEGVLFDDDYMEFMNKKVIEAFDNMPPGQLKKHIEDTNDTLDYDDNFPFTACNM